MSGSSLGFVIEGLVALLLVVTIAYCAVLNRRLKRLRADEQALHATIAELVQATGIAERAIVGFKDTAGECDRNLSHKLQQADRFSRSIELQISQGEKILARLARISSVARQHGLADRPSAGEPADQAGASHLTGRAA